MGPAERFAGFGIEPMPDHLIQTLFLLYHPVLSAFLLKKTIRQRTTRTKVKVKPLVVSSPKERFKHEGEGEA